jgi:hypothetical protein
MACRQSARVNGLFRIDYITPMTIATAASAPQLAVDRILETL